MLALAHGNSYSITVSVSDTAGNPATPVSDTLEVRLAPPDIPTINVLNTNDTTPVISGKAQKENPNAANTYIALTDAMNSHDVGRDRGGVAEALATIKIPVVVISIDSDRLFWPRLQEEIIELTPTALPLVTISSPFGHDGFLIEVETVGSVLRDALAIGLTGNSSK
jgi:hypothetical protein